MQPHRQLILEVVVVDRELELVLVNPVTEQLVWLLFDI